MLAMGLPLAACQTASFAPPQVNPQLKAYVGGAGGCSARVNAVAEEQIDRDVNGAMTLTDNYIFAYRCAEQQLADGRQYFQLPAFAAAAIGLAGPSLGLGADGTLIAGTTAGMFNTGNGYYAPRTKAGMVSAALRALVCIKTEAAGVSYFQLVADEEKDDGQGETAEVMAATTSHLDGLLATLRAQATELEARRASDPAAEEQLRANWALQQQVIAALVSSTLAVAAAGTDDSVFIPAEVQYFQMVAGALYSVESILGERLRDAGSADTKEIFEQLTKLAEEHAAAKEKLKKAKEKGGGETGADGQGTQEVLAVTEATMSQQLKLIELENEVLQPRLQICVLQTRS